MPLSHFLATCKVVLSCGLGRDQPPFAGFRLVERVSFWCFVLALQPDRRTPDLKITGRRYWWGAAFFYGHHPN
jgi:hypothetical protein